MAQWYAVCKKVGGGLVSLGTVVSSQLPNDLEAVPCEAPSEALAWDEATKAFMAAPPKVKMLATFLADPEIQPFLDKLTQMEKQFLKGKLMEHLGDV